MQWQPHPTLRRTPPAVRPPSPPVTRPLREVMFGWASLTGSYSAEPPAETYEPASAPAESTAELDALDEL